MNGNGHRPAQLGNVTMRRGNGDGWELLVDGRRVLDDLTFQQVTAIIRGELPIPVPPGEQRDGWGAERERPGAHAAGEQGL